jgi:hypothetical protein
MKSNSIMICERILYRIAASLDGSIIHPVLDGATCQKSLRDNVCHYVSVLRFNK